MAGIYSPSEVKTFQSYTIRHSCENDAYRIIKNRPLGAGFYGYVFEACPLSLLKNGLPSKCQFVVKVIDLTHLEEKKIQKELIISDMAGRLGVGPKIIDVWICDNFPESRLFYEESEEELSLDVESKLPSGFEYPTWSKKSPYLFILMEKAPGETLMSYLKRNRYIVPEGLCEALDDAITKLFQAGIIYGDLHGENVLVEEQIMPDASVVPGASDESSWKVTILD